MELRIKSFFKYTAVIFFYSLLSAWSCTAVSEGEEVIQLLSVFKMRSSTCLLSWTAGISGCNTV